MLLQVQAHLGLHSVLLVMETLWTLATETVLLQAARQPQLLAVHLETRVEPSRK